MRTTTRSFLASATLFAALAACSGADPGPDGAPPSTEDTVGLAGEELALAVAADELAASVDRSSEDAWTTESSIVAAYPLYRPGSDAPAYYECKIATKGQDAGFILVNVDESDLLVPEAAPEGNTSTERYREALGDRPFRVVRIDWFRSAALDSDGRVLASEGFESSEHAERQIVAIAGKASSEQAFPLYSREQLDAYYRELREGSSQDWSPQVRGDQAQISQAAEWRSIYAELSGTFGSSWHTPSWYQVRRTDGYPIGCAATAWAEVYGFWRQFRGAGKLFDSLDLTDRYEFSDADAPEIAWSMHDIASAMGTVFGGSGDGKYGLTWPWDACKGTKYATDRGYGASCERDRGTEYSKFDKVRSSLSQNRPVILLIGADENDHVGNHYVVIEAAEKSQTKYLWVWHDRNVKYLVNYGWGTTRKWIYVRDWGANQHDVYASFSAYHINLSIPAGPAHGGTLFGGHEYRLDVTPRSWSAAKTYCEDRGAHLVTIGSAEENGFVSGLLQAAATTRSWTGLSRQWDGTFRWVTNEPLVYTSFSPGEPNGGASEPFVEVRSSGSWNDLPSTWSAATICEFE